MGHSSSFVTSTTAKGGTVYGVIQLSYAATSPLLSDRINYRYFSRVVPPDNFQTKAMLALLENLYQQTNQIQWKQLGVICTTDAYGLELSKTLISDAAADGTFTISSFQQFIPKSSDISVEMNELKQSKARVFIAPMLFGDWGTVLNEALRLEIINENHIWLCPDGCTTSNTILLPDGSFNTTKVAAMTGMIGTQPYAPNAGDLYDSFIAQWASLDPVQYPGGGNLGVIDIFTQTSYDSAVFFMTALKTYIEDGNEIADDGRFDINLFYEYLKNTTILGLSGEIILNQQAERKGIYNLMNFVPSRGYWSPFGSWSEVAGLKLDIDIVWNDNTTDIPDIDIRPPFDYWSCEKKEIRTDRTGKTIKLEKPDGDDVKNIDDSYHCDQFIDCKNISDESVDCGSNYMALFIAYGIVTGFLILLACVFIILTVVFSKCFRRKRFMAASPVFLLILCFSVIVGYASTYAWYGKPHPVACGFQPWLLGLSVVSMISALIAKKFRIWRIFSSPFKKKSIKDLELFVLWIVLVLPALVILIIWTIVSTPTAKLKEVDGEDHYVCDTGGFTGPPGGYVFFFILVGYEGIVLAVGAFLSVVTRKVPALYNESKLLAVSIYNLIFLSVIVIPVYLILLHYNPFAAWIIRTTAILYAFTATLLLQYVPILVGLIITDHCKDLDLQKMSSAGTSTQTMSQSVEN